MYDPSVDGSPAPAARWRGAAERAYASFDRARARANAWALSLVVRDLGAGVRVYRLPRLIAPERVRIGARTTINHGVVINGVGGVTIGERVRLSTYAVLESEFLLPNVLPRKHVTRPIVLEDGVWVGTGAIVLAGVRIGRDSIVAAGAVVTKDVPERSVAVGVPATFRPLPGAEEGQHR